MDDNLEITVKIDYPKSFSKQLVPLVDRINKLIAELELKGSVILPEIEIEG